MKQLLIFLLLISTILSKAFAENLSEKDEQVLQECPDYAVLKKQLEDWMIPALASPHGIGCPPKSVDLILSKLEKIGVENRGTVCGNAAFGSIIAFYAFFNEHPNYGMCGLGKRQNLFEAKVATEGAVCEDSTSDEISDCFFTVFITIGKLKLYSEMDAAFELARKTANSNDVTGFSQMALGGAYLWGNGTNKDVPLAIKWYKEALEKLDEKDKRIHAIIALSVAYEEIGDYKNAIKYSQQCASLGDEDCKKMLIRIEDLS